MGRGVWVGAVGLLVVGCNAIEQRLTVLDEPAGENCEAGGVRVETSERVAFVCNGSGGSTEAPITVAAEPEGNNCEAGGARVMVGAQTFFICDGVAGVAGSPGKDGQAGADGQDGADGKDGKDGQNGRDGEDGQNGQDGLNGKDGKDGANGMPAPPVTISVEPPGRNCSAGGVIVTVGSERKYVCNGVVNGWCEPADSMTAVNVQGVAVQTMTPTADLPAGFFRAYGYCLSLANDFDAQTGVVRVPPPAPEPMRIFAAIDARALPLLAEDLHQGAARTVKVQRFATQPSGLVGKVDDITLTGARMLGLRLESSVVVGRGAGSIVELDYAYTQLDWERSQTSTLATTTRAIASFVGPGFERFGSTPIPSTAELSKTVAVDDALDFTSSALAVCHPVARESGSATSVQHYPVVLVKPVDDGSSLLLAALSAREVLDTVTIGIRRPNPQGFTETYLRMILKDAVVVEVRQAPDPTSGDAVVMMETVTLVYDHVTWDSPTQSTTFSASW